MPKKLILKNRINRVGIELEGGWDKLPKGTRALVRESSVKFNEPKFEVNALGKIAPVGAVYPGYIGEIPSPVLTPAGWEQWLRDHYPQHVNETCGLHTHVSFKSQLNYMRLMTPDFTSFMIKGLVAWAEEMKFPKDHPIWGRVLKKNHEHCAHIYLGDAQVRVPHRDYKSRGEPWSRYTALNYCFDDEDGPKGAKKTVECRVLPMFETADQAVRAVDEVFKLTNQFLAKVRLREPRAEARISLSPPTEEAYRIHV